MDPSAGRYAQPERAARLPRLLVHKALIGQRIYGYAYANNNPVNSWDFDGLLPPDGGVTDRFIDSQMETVHACNAGDQNSCNFLAGQLFIASSGAAFISLPLLPELLATPAAAPITAAATQCAARAKQYLGPSGPVFGRQYGLFNSNDLFRIGWGWSQPMQSEVFRISIGGPNMPSWLPIWWHIDLFYR